MTSSNAEQKRNESVATLMKEMETTAYKMRALIVGMPPKDLLGYIYTQRVMQMTPSGNQATVVA